MSQINLQTYVEKCIILKYRKGYKIYKVQKLNESFYKIEADMPSALQNIKRILTLKIPNAYFDPMIKRGLKPDSEVFYAIDGDSIIVPSGLMPFMEKFGIHITNTPEFTEDEVDSFINSLGIPFELYDYQREMVIDSILKKQVLGLAATGCLDPESKVNVEISKESFELIKKFRNK